MEASKRRRSLLDHKIQQLSKGSSEGSGIIPEFPDGPKDNSEVTEKQDGNVQTNLTLSSAELKIQSTIDVPIHQEDPVVQRTPLIDTFISMTSLEISKHCEWTCKDIDYRLIKEQNDFIILVTQSSFQDYNKYEHVGPKVTSTQDGERSQDDDQRLHLADDLKKLKITYRVKLKGTSSIPKSKITTSKYKISNEESKTMS
ncbi:hypothetical protein Tco_0290169 [Tanacetum coccineum]